MSKNFFYKKEDNSKKYTSMYVGTYEAACVNLDQP